MTSDGDSQEATPKEVTEGLDQTDSCLKSEEVPKLLTNVKQNFGKINVGPEFTEEDLVPVELLDFSDEEEAQSEEEDVGSDGPDGGEESEDGEDGSEKAEEPKTAPAKAEVTDSRQVVKELDQKIAKYKQFLSRAKCKRFSAIRCVPLSQTVS